ncbi:MAG: metabolite traffic protein EboE [Fimbriimonadales bacterium]
MKLGGDLGHLTYSTLVHPGDTWEEMWDSLNRYLPAVKRRFSPSAPFGVSIRISRKSADRLSDDHEERARLKQFLRNNDMYLFTANAFPYGAFKGERVKERVYEPDWRTDERAQYTMLVADILADVAPEGIAPSIQSPPLGFKPRVTGSDVVDAYTRQVLRVVSYLVELERRTGRTVSLALEPEPACFLEVTSETVAYFADHLYAPPAIKVLAANTGLSHPQAERALRRHLGVVFDVCHQAVEFEDIAGALGSLKRAGIPVMKLQAAAAVRIPEVSPDAVAALKPFDDPVYLHQTVERRGEATTRFLDLSDAFADWESRPRRCEWRTHFHVPVFLEDLGPFKTTRPAIEEALRVHKADPVSPQVEIETYTWDVLPENLKTGDITDYVVRELEWVRKELTGA